MYSIALFLQIFTILVTTAGTIWEFERFVLKKRCKGEICMAVTKGLEGVIATTSSISSIIDDSLAYVGYDIDVLAE